MSNASFRFGEMLLLQRHKNKMTQKYLAYQLGVSTKTISRWENNETAPDILQIEKLKELLGYGFYVDEQYILDKTAGNKRSISKVLVLLLGAFVLIESIAIVVLMVRL